MPVQKRSIRIFISHSSDDLAFTEQLAQDLRTALADPEAVWYDASHLTTRESWRSTILAELNRSTVCLIVCSPQGMRSPWVDEEINIAWGLRNSGQLFRLIPLLYQPCALRSDLDTLQYIDFLKSNLYQQAFQKLLKALDIGSMVPGEQQEDHRQQQAIQRPPISSDGVRLIEQGSSLLTRHLSRRMVIGGVTALLVTGGSIVWWLDDTHMPQISHVAQLAPIPQSIPIPIPQSTPDPLIGTLLYTYKGNSSGLGVMAWSPDGKRIASACGDGTVQVWNAADGSHLYIYKNHSYNPVVLSVLAVAWSPDGKWIASGGMDEAVSVWNAADGTLLYAFTAHTNDVNAAAWSPDSKRIASGSDDGTVRVWNVADGSQPYIYRGHLGNVLAVTWSPDGKRIASGGLDGTVQVWNAVDGTQYYTYTDPAGGEFAVAWSPDGKHIALGSGNHTVQVWNAVDGTQPITCTGHSDGVRAVAWSPDSKRIVSGSLDGTARVWNAGDGTQLYIYKGHSSGVGSVAWSPDGKRIASSGNNTVQEWIS